VLRINLNVLEKKKKLPIKGDFWIFIFLLIVLLGGCVAVNWWVGVKIDYLKTVEEQKTKEKRSLQSLIAKVNNLKKDVEDIQKKLEVIKKIRQRQILPVLFIDALVSSLPGDKIWYKSLSLASSGSITITGVALDNQVLSFYIEQLKKSPYVKGVDIVVTTRTKIGNYELVEFTCNLRAGEA